MAEHKYLPCPSWVWTDDTQTRKWYCEQGNKNHWGTCCGGKSSETYEWQVTEAREKMKAARDDT